MQSKVRNTFTPLTQQRTAALTAHAGVVRLTRYLIATLSPLSLCLVRRRARTWRIASAALLDTQSFSKTPGGASNCSQMRMGHTE
jgi:hypothetical protein